MMTAASMAVSRIVVVAAVCVASVAPSAAQSPVAQPDPGVQLETLFLPGNFADAADVFGFISEGLESTHDRTRERALGAIVARSFMPNLRGLEGRGWEAEAVHLRKLKPRVRELTLDENADVREAALMAFAVLDREEGDATRRLGDETIALCVTRYGLEAEPAVRAQAVRIIAFDESAEAGRKTIATALEDRDEGVVAAAILGVEEHRLSSQLPRLAALLGHASANVRLTAAGVMSTFGDEAEPYLPRLEQALAVETDRLAADTIRGAIAAIRERVAGVR
jgi:hypothetical protein